MRYFCFVLSVTALFFSMASTVLAHKAHRYPSHHPRHNVHVDAPKLTLQSDARTCMALAMYYEARGESDKGMMAVGFVILNRSKARRFPPKVCGVVLQSRRIKGRSTRVCQFSWACKSIKHHRLNVAQWQRAQLLAILVMTESIPNPIKDAIYFHASSYHHRPTRHANIQAKIGHHVFFADHRVYRSTNLADPKAELAVL